MNMANQKRVDMLILWGLRQGYSYRDFIESGGDWRDHIYPYALSLYKEMQRNGRLL